MDKPYAATSLLPIQEPQKTQEPNAKKEEYKITKEQKLRFTPSLYAATIREMDRMTHLKVRHNDCHSLNLIIEQLTPTASNKDDWKVTPIDFDFAEDDPYGSSNYDQLVFENRYKAWIGSDKNQRWEMWQEHAKK